MKTLLLALILFPTAASADPDSCTETSVGPCIPSDELMPTPLKVRAELVRATPGLQDAARDQGVRGRGDLGARRLRK